MMLLAGPSTARDLLYDDTEADQSAGLAVDLSHSLDELSPSALSSSVRQSIQRDVADAAMGLLELDLTDVLASGWQKHSHLRAAGKRTKEAPGTLETVVLAEHRISYDAHPYVDVLLGDAHLTRVKLTLLITVDITGLEASISAGRLKSVSAGKAIVTASLDLAGVPVARRRSRDVRLPSEIGLGDGLRLA
jgi:hypothetical protein